MPPPIRAPLPPGGNHPPGIAARRGSATHKAAQVNHEQKRRTQADLPVGDLEDAARDHYFKIIKEEGVFIPKDQVPEKDALLAKGLEAAIRLTQLYRQSLAPAIHLTLVEEKLTLDVGLALPLQGTIDVLTRDNWLPDLKTADKSKGVKEADYSLQLTFYAGLVAHQTGKWPEKVSLEVLVNAKEPKLQSLPSHQGPEDWSNLLYQVAVKQVGAGSPRPWSDNWRIAGGETPPLQPRQLMLHV